MSAYGSRINDRINDWFHDRGDGEDLSPQDSVFRIADEFEKQIRHCGLQLNIPFHTFVKTLCDATCTLYRAHLEGKDVACPTKIANLPKKWTTEIEAIWTDWVYTFHLTDEFWTGLWYEVPEAIWEAPFPRYRTWIQSLLPNYIQRENEPLENEGLIRQKSGGEFVDAQETEDYEEDGYESH